MTDDLKRRVLELSGFLVSWRRSLHKRPELGFAEHETAAFVAAGLRRLDMDVRTGVAKTGERFWRFPAARHDAHLPVRQRPVG